MCRGARRLLTASRPRARRANAAPGTPDSPLQNKFERTSPEARCGGFIEGRIARIGAKRFANRAPRLRSPSGEVADAVAGTSISALNCELTPRNFVSLRHRGRVGWAKSPGTAICGYPMTACDFAHAVRLRGWTAWTTRPLLSRAMQCPSGALPTLPSRRDEVRCRALP